MKARWQITWLLTYPWAQWLLGLKVSGRNHLVGGPQIIAANHTSNFDPLIVGWAAGRELHFLAKEELFCASPLFAWLLRSWNAWPVRRGTGDAGAIRRCSWLLQHGQTVVLFPEGTRSPTGELRPFQPGVGLLALVNRVPVIPLHITGMTRSLISYWVDRDFVRLGYRQRPRRRGPIVARFAEPVLPVGFPLGRAGYRALTQEVEARVRSLARS